MRNKLFAVVLLLILLIIFSTFLRIDYIGGYADGDLLWTEKEAYLFLRGERWGYEFSYLGYAVQVIKNYFGIIAPPDRREAFTKVIRIAPSGIEHYEEKKLFDFFTPLDNGVFAWGADRDSWKWVSNHFEKPSTDERQKLGGWPSLPMKDLANPTGWSAKYSITTKIKEQFSIQIGGLSVAVKLKGGEVSVSVRNPDRNPEMQTLTERIYYGDGRPQRVNKADYQHVFGD